MDDTRDIRRSISQALADDFNVSGEELDYLLHVVKTNADGFLLAIPKLVEGVKWEALATGSDKLIALAETLGWPELGEGAFALKEAAKQRNRQAIAIARHKLRSLMAKFDGHPSNPTGTARL